MFEIPMPLLTFIDGCVADNASNRQNMIMFSGLKEQHYTILYHNHNQNDLFNIIMELETDIHTISNWYDNFRGQREKINHVYNNLEVMKDLFKMFYKIL